MFNFNTAETIEFFIGNVRPENEIKIEDVLFSNIGKINFSKNVFTDFKARELKNINTDCAGQFLKLVFSKNHLNKLNIYNQVSKYSHAIYFFK